jgi:hypothetical protein
MDIEHLNKTQIVLLTLLVSFVTSIATGIVTVSLMQQAPPTVAQTVNRIVERTVEKIVPQSQSAAAASVQTKTVIVDETSLIPDAVAKAAPSIVRLLSSTEKDASLLSLGVVVAPGRILTDAAPLGDNASATLTLPDGTRIQAFVIARDEDTGTATLDAATSTGTAPTWRVAAVGKRPALGATIVAFSGSSSNRIGGGLVTAVGDTIETDLVPAILLPGSPIFDTSGAFVGISTGVSRKSNPSAFQLFPTAPKTE